ncbi:MULTISPECIES: TetR/AcrR family transcriptional regulator [unclassified Beijerinckia]|uniref:TetR/AcrR family transcriptional regulator n=1 Tax=unclassified Beijerinckia TaxID=2638183 RepID=UPI000894BFD4|nr:MULTISPECIES: TetR/AcrR family transcriptional regulator [unclassified Beijerinckia]MDH7796158.1 AcrR family transcriptional regulator [Beijerinckia sp. GAS462]SEC32912.1 transcriptional regulator, TetR family [Beijerinckia sp. 28-YEA-48]
MKQSGSGKRRTQAERRSETQAAILAAAMQILAEDGYLNFSASRVASVAGVSRGAQEHYFPRKADLMEAAVKHAMAEAVDHAERLSRTVNHTSDPIEKFLIDSEHFFFSPMFRALMEIMIACRSDRELATVVNPVVRKARITLNRIWTETLSAAGYPEESARQFVEVSHFTMRGFFLVSTWLPYKVDRKAMVEALRQLAPVALHMDAPARAPARTATRRIPKG